MYIYIHTQYNTMRVGLRKKKRVRKKVISNMVTVHPKQIERERERERLKGIEGTTTVYGARQLARSRTARDRGQQAKGGFHGYVFSLLISQTQAFLF